MHEIVDQIDLEDGIKQALLTRSGPLGTLLRLIEAKEAEHLEEVTALVAELAPLKLSDLIAAELQAVVWAREVTAAEAAA